MVKSKKKKKRKLKDLLSAMEGEDGGEYVPLDPANWRAKAM